jgi:hypothetical protein
MVDVNNNARYILIKNRGLYIFIRKNPEGRMIGLDNVEHKRYWQLQHRSRQEFYQKGTARKCSNEPMLKPFKNIFADFF